MNAFLRFREALLPQPGGEPISTDLPRGALTALIGPNGSGKTTLLRATLGERVLRSGAIHLGERAEPVARLHPMTKPASSEAKNATA